MPDAAPAKNAIAEVFGAFLLLGCTSFGGPVAHLGYFREAFVTRRGWLSATEYADIVALCQFLPGPASSQVGIAIGHLRAGYAGAVAAWVGFTAPSVLLLLIFAYGLALWPDLLGSGILRGLQIAALAVVAQAVWQMAVGQAPDRTRRLVMVVAAVAVLLMPSSVGQLATLGAAAIGGALFWRRAPVVEETDGAPAVGYHKPAVGFLGVFFLLLIVLPILAQTGGAWMVADKFYRTGSLVFGGGHVVLPLLQSELVDPGLIASDTFVGGYGAAQAVPGPLFSFAAYAGAMLRQPPNGLAGALLALGAIYLPSFLLVLGALPVWRALRQNQRLRGALDIANAAVVGLLLAALYDPVFTSAVAGPQDLALAIAAFAALALLRLPPWLVVILCAAAGVALR